MNGEVKRFLFVCVENACRSQMAEGFLNALAEGKVVAESAGNKPAERVNPLAVQVMKETGINIAKHKPKMLTAEMIQEADKVIFMGCGGNACPAVPKEVVDWNIEDPARKGIEKFREVRDIIRRRVKGLLDGLEANEN
ncbi:MAG: arsenate reductase ArsC [Candidatus Bathyarchaeota archaeon]|nr:arsenate reductase ArsC [Candidatus Bathyarchaeota archaeon]